MAGRSHLGTHLGAHLGTAVATLVDGVRHGVHDWSVASQQQARRNAMVATTACAQRRAEREEVADYLAGRAQDEHVTPDPSARIHQA